MKPTTISEYSNQSVCFAAVAKPEIIHHDFVPNLRFLSRYGSFDDLGDWLDKKPRSFVDSVNVH